MCAWMSPSAHWHHLRYSRVHLARSGALDRTESFVPIPADAQITNSDYNEAPKGVLRIPNKVHQPKTATIIALTVTIALILCLFTVGAIIFFRHRSKITKSLPTTKREIVAHTRKNLFWPKEVSPAQYIIHEGPNVIVTAQRPLPPNLKSILKRSHELPSIAIEPKSLHSVDQSQHYSPATADTTEERVEEIFQVTDSAHGGSSLVNNRISLIIPDDADSSLDISSMESLDHEDSQTGSIDTPLTVAEGYTSPMASLNEPGQSLNNSLEFAHRSYTAPASLILPPMLEHDATISSTSTNFKLTGSFGPSLKDETLPPPAIIISAPTGSTLGSVYDTPGYSKVEDIWSLSYKVYTGREISQVPPRFSVELMTKECRAPPPRPERSPHRRSVKQNEFM